MSSGISPEFYGRYQVLGVLGKGGFGTVYTGLDTQLQRQVAIKVPHRQLAKSETDLFLREARRLAQLKHPGIVKVFDVGIQDGQSYIISDLVAGVSLRDWLRDHRPTVEQTIDIVAAVADALSHAHAQGLIHRDIKPSNIVLTENLLPILLDFGLAVTEEDVSGQAESILGTPAYMSPERQARKETHRIDGRTDIYSLGVILYQMLCGRRPFNAPDLYELMRQAREDEPQPPRQRNPSIPPELERICLKAMSKRISDRHTTASDLAAELRAALRPKTARLLSPAATSAQSASGEPSGDSTHSMGTCPVCLRPHQPDAAFCASCGAPLSPVALNTSEPLTSVDGERPAGSNVDGGPETSRLSTAPTTRRDITPAAAPVVREAERRQITILYCNHNLNESVELIEILDSAERDLLLGRWRKLCEDVVDRYQGTVLSSASPGLMVCFGYPTAFEDAAHRAVLTSLRLLKGMTQLGTKFDRLKGISLTTWITIHTGSAVVGDGGGSQESMSVMGEARNVATRLEPLAEPGTIVISESVHRLVQGYFVCEGLGRHTIKGLAEPIGLFRVLEHGTARSRIEVAGASGLTPLIGRDLEVSLLLDRWQQAKEGIGQTVLFAGEAGIGKSRLVHVIKERVSQEVRDETVPYTVEWRCSPFYQNSSLYPVTEAFERLLSFQPEDSPDERLNKLINHLRPVGLYTDELVTLFAGLLSIPLDEKRYPPLSQSPQRQKERTLEALVDWIRACAEKQGMLFVVEDLHWVDASTLEVLGMIVQQGAGDRLLCVLTSRPEFHLSGTGWMHLTQVALNRLNRQQVAELIRRKSGIPHLPPSLVDQIVSRTDGVPLFVEEFTQMVLEAGILREVDGEITLTSSVLVQSIPATLQDLLVARLDRMGSQREVVQLASALGREFSFDLLRAVSPLDEPALRQELAKLVSAEILFLKGRPPHASYQFKHALIQEAAYQSLLKSRRQQFHKRIAQAIEQHFAERAEREPELLAHHYTEAGLIREALVYWEKAGRRANERSAHTEAIAHLTQGLDLLSLLEESPGRDLQEFRLQLLLGVAVLSVEGYAAPRQRAIYDRARELCVKLGAREPLIQVTRGIWAWRLIRDELEYGAELAREMSELATALDNPSYRMEAHFAVGCNAFYRGEFVTSRRECDLGFKLYTPERGRFQCGYTGQDPGVTNQCYIALALWYLGYPEQAQRRIAQTVAFSKELGHPFSHVFALYHETFLKQQCRQGPETQKGGEALQALAEDQGFPFWIALGMLTQGTGLLLQDSCDDASTWLRKGLNALRQTGAGIVVPHFTLWLAEAYGKARRFDEAFATLDEASSLVDNGKELFNEPELHRIRGELLLAQSGGTDPDVAPNALTCFGRAREAASRQRSRSLELRATTCLARLLGRHGRREEAREILTPVYEWFTEGFDTADLHDARSLLAALDENHEPSFPGAF